MTDPDKLTELKARVKAAEEQLSFQQRQTIEESKSNNDSLLFLKIGKELQLIGNLIIAYREYVTELEKYVPR